jgi:hypothetical protein
VAPLQLAKEGSHWLSRSVGCEPEWLAHGFHAPLHDGTTAGDFLAKLSETGGVAQEFQPRKLAGASGPLANAFGVGGEANLPAFAKATAWQAVEFASPARSMTPSSSRTFPNRIMS